jgi:hypothetical protein
MIPVCSESTPIQFFSTSVLFGREIRLIGKTGQLGINGLAKQEFSGRVKRKIEEQWLQVYLCGPTGGVSRKTKKKILDVNFFKIKI